MKVVALSGGVGGAKLADGLASLLPPDALTVIVNVADDFEWYGLTICPDLDTVLYTMSGIEHVDHGYGIRNDTFACVDALAQLDAALWFRVGDQDLATHFFRSSHLWQGKTLTDVTRRLCRTRGLNHPILPVTDDLLRTIVETDEGALEFQDYFVRRQCKPVVKKIFFRGLETATPSDAVMAALGESDVVIICPSNPFVSVGPILALPGVRDIVSQKPTLAVSPIIGGAALKGPAAKIFRELGREPSALEVAREYAGVIKTFVMDDQDRHLEEEISCLGMKVHVTDTLMLDRPGRKRLASAILEWARMESGT